MKVLCVLGQHQYGCPRRGQGIEYVAFLPALRRLGHTVLHFESWNRSCYRDLAELNERLIATVAAERPDVLLAVAFTEEVWLETIRLIGQMGVATICWATDDSWKYGEQSRFLGKAFQTMATTYPEVVRKYQRDGIENVLVTQWAARADAMRPPLAARDCRYAVSFVGTTYGNRVQQVASLRRLGVDVECFGYGWPNGPVAEEDIPRIMRESVISLNFANSRGANQIKARTFEVPGAGGFLMTEYTPGLERFYQIGEEIDVFRTTEELGTKVRHYLEHPEKRDAVAQAGFDRTRREHTYDERMREVVEFALRHRPGATACSITEEFQRAVGQHRLSSSLRCLGGALVALCRVVYGRERARQAARRLVHEFSWRFLGEHTYTSRGWAGRMFPQWQERTRGAA